MKPGDEIESKTHKAKLNERGVLTVMALPQAATVVRETVMAGGQAVQRVIKSPAEAGSPALADVVSYLQRTPIFAAGHESGGSFDVDCAAGVQRWTGPQDAAAVRKALRRCDFSAKQAKEIVAAAMKFTGVSAPSYH
jgi:hypothetical protein